ncbi:MAG: High-affinity zinc uptake system membrane protein ZnuB [Chlamydiae bacterium]|nr:High-affinity zinc uptake system membrane protein ZnuB [Chlamydiota bacterium]
MVEALQNNPFLLMALLAGLAASVTSGIVGAFVVIKRIVFLSGSIAHSVLGGMGLCLYLKRSYGIEWITPMQGALASALIAALLIGWIHLRYREREDTVIAAIWATGMSLGVIFISLTPGYNVELLNYLFGNILWVSKSDIALLFGLDLLVILIVALFRHRFLAICFDETQSWLQKVPVQGLYMLLLCLIALSVVLLIQVVGAILIIAMLAIPAALASQMTGRFLPLMGLAVLIGAAVTVTGTTCSYLLNWPPGATIALTAAVLYLLSFSVRPKTTG